MYLQLDKNNIITQVYYYNPNIPNLIKVDNKKQQEVIRENFKVKYENGKLEVIEKEAPKIEEEPKLTDKQRIAQLEQAILELSMRGL